MSKALIVIDVQRCFLPGGSLAVGKSGGDTDKMFVRSIYNFVKSTAFNDVYFTQDMHHPENTSMQNMHLDEIEKNKEIKKIENRRFINLWKGELDGEGLHYLRKNTYNTSKSTRRWGDANELALQAMWPRHCIIPKDDPYYPKEYTGPKNANKLNDGQYGSDLAYELNEFKDTKPAGISATVYTVYKGFDADKDSYSAIADATGVDTPFIAKINGVSQAPERKRFLAQLKENPPKDIYICGIATDYCVYQTAMDLLDLFVFENKDAPRDTKIHFIHDLTRAVDPSAKTPEKLNEAVKIFLERLGVPPADVSKYFVVEMSNKVHNNLKVLNTTAMEFSGLSNITVGGRHRMNKTRRAHMRGCNCKTCWRKMKGGKRSTRKPAGHKKGCKCIICKRR